MCGFGWAVAARPLTVTAVTVAAARSGRALVRTRAFARRAVGRARTARVDASSRPPSRPPQFIEPQFSYPTVSFGTLGLFLTCALGISALPVLARILSERRMLQSRLGGLSMTIAAVDDVMAWCLLAIVIAIVRANSQLEILWVLLLTVSEVLVMWCVRGAGAGRVCARNTTRRRPGLPHRPPLPYRPRRFVVRPLIALLVRRGQAFSHLSADVFLLLCLILIACCWFTEVIGLSSLIGAFQVGLIIPRNSHLSESLSEKFEYFTVGILMPLYFTNRCAHLQGMPARRRPACRSRRRAGAPRTTPAA